MSVTQLDVRPHGPRRLDRALPDRRALSILVVAQWLAGVLAGVLWLAWAPSSVSYLLDSGTGTGIVVPAESESQVAGDGRYVLITALLGLLFGLLTWRLRGSRGRLTLAVLAVSSLLSSLIALGTGQLLSGGHRATKLNTAFHPQLQLHATAAVFAQALLAVLLYTVLTGLSSSPTLGRDEPAAQRDGTAGHNATAERNATVEQNHTADAGDPTGHYPAGPHEQPADQYAAEPAHPDQR